MDSIVRVLWKGSMDRIVTLLWTGQHGQCSDSFVDRVAWTV